MRGDFFLDKRSFLPILLASFFFLMSKKYAIFLLLPLLTSCSLGTKNFDDLYSAHMKSQVQNVQTLAEAIGIGKKYAIDGSLHLAAGLPGVMSRSFDSEYLSKIDGQSGEFHLKNLKAITSSIVSSGSITADDIGMIAKTGDSYFFLKGINATSDTIDTSMLSVIKKYENTWLSLTRAEMTESFSGSEGVDALSYKVTENLAALTLDDIESYLTKYPVLRSTKDLGMSGSLQSYEVALDTEAMVNLVSDFGARVTGSGMTQEAKDELRTKLSEVNLKGVLSLDPKDASVSQFVGTVSASGSADPTSISFSTSQKGMKLSTKNVTNSFVIGFEKNDTGYTFDTSMGQNGQEIAKLIGTVTNDRDRIAKVNITVTAQGMTITLDHANNADGSFSGSANLGLGNASWSGMVADHKLTRLGLQGIALGNTLTMTLGNPVDDMIRGPLQIEAGGSKVFDATLGLRLIPERVSVNLDITAPGRSEITTHFESDITARMSSWNGSVEAPTNTKPLKSLTDELDAVVPAGVELPDDSTISVASGKTSTGIVQ